MQQASRLVSSEGLTTLSRDGRIVARLAESWTTSADGLNWTFRLRPNAFFHDGSPVDSSAVKGSLERSLAGIDRDLSPGLGDISSIETPSSHELIIRMRERSTFLLDALSVAINKVTAGSTVGAGPYMSGKSIDGEIRMEAFSRYYGGTPQIQSVVWKAYPTVRTAWAGMMRGEVDFLYEVGQDAREFIEGEASTTVFPFSRQYAYGVIFNSRRDFFKDRRVRRALNHAVNRSALVQSAFGGHARPTDIPSWPEHWAFDSSVPRMEYDPAKALALLEAANVTSFKVMPGRAPARIHFTCLFPENLPLWERIALVVQRDLSDIGIDMELQSVPIAQFNQRLVAGDFDTVLLEIVVGNSASRPYTFWHGASKQNVWGYSSPTVDSALDTLRRASDEQEYRQAFRQFQLATGDDPPAVFLALSETTRAVSKRFEVVAPAGSDILPTIADWRLADGTRRGAN
jgi:peptide/nickel transport system substrate-binding protein